MATRSCIPFCSIACMLADCWLMRLCQAGSTRMVEDDQLEELFGGVELTLGRTRGIQRGRATVIERLCHSCRADIVTRAERTGDYRRGHYPLFHGLSVEVVSQPRPRDIRTHLLPEV